MNVPWIIGYEVARVYERREGLKSIAPRYLLGSMVSSDMSFSFE